MTSLPTSFATAPFGSQFSLGLLPNDKTARLLQLEADFNEFSGRPKGAETVRLVTAADSVQHPRGNFVANTRKQGPVVDDRLRMNATKLAESMLAHFRKAKIVVRGQQLEIKPLAKFYREQMWQLKICCRTVLGAEGAIVLDAKKDAWIYKADANVDDPIEQLRAILSGAAAREYVLEAGNSSRRAFDIAWNRLPEDYRAIRSSETDWRSIFTRSGLNETSQLDSHVDDVRVNGRPMLAGHEKTYHQMVGLVRNGSRLLRSLLGR